MSSTLFAILCLSSITHAENTITGTVQSLDGTVITDAIVYLFDTRSKYMYARSDAQGAFSFDVENGPYRMLAVPTAWDNFVPSFYPDTQDYCTAEQIEPGTELNIILEEGVSISGTLESPSGEFIEGAIITAQNDVSSVERGAMSDEQGNFLIQGLSKDEAVGWSCAIEVDGWPEQYIGPSYEESEATIVQSGDIGTHQLKEGIILGGTIEGPDGMIPNAEVFAYSASQVISGESDEDGYFSLRGLPPGDVLIWSSALGYATTYAPNFDRPTEFVSLPEEGSEKLDFSLQLPSEKTLRVALVDDGPVLGASVLLYNDNSTVGRGAPVDDQGVATIDRLHGGSYNLQIYAENDGYFNEWYSDDEGTLISIELTGDLDLEIPLTPGSNLSGYLLDDQDKPIYGADITLYNDLETQRARSGVDGFYQVWGLYEGAWDMSVVYAPLCPTDRSYVPMYYPNEPIQQESIFIVDGENNHDVLLPIDDDHDAMPDVWEEEFGLDPQRDDAQDDPDNDGISNLDEYYNQSNPNEPQRSSSCGCSGSESGFIFFPLVLFSLRRRK
jgi:hypothetical protein